MVAGHFCRKELFWKSQILGHHAFVMKEILCIYQQRASILHFYSTYKHSLQLTNSLMLNGLTIYFSNFISNMKRSLAMYHSTMHYSGYNTSTIFGHFQCYTLSSFVFGKLVTHFTYDIKNVHHSCWQYQLTIGSSVFFWNWTKRTLVTCGRSPFSTLSTSSPLRYGAIGGGVTRNASSP